MTKASPEQVHRAVTQFSSAILTMQAVDDLERLVVALWVELQTLRLDIAYCGINIFHEAEQTLDFYGVHEAGLLIGPDIPFSLGFQCEGLPRLAEALQHFKEGKLFCYTSSARDMAEWMGRLQQAGIDVTGPGPAVSDEMYNLVEVPFNGGTMVLARKLDNPFDDGCHVDHPEL